ncbi:hypothetical protein PFISCL1PPCAC_10052, partial [Pristionchus fissidentatus]
FACIAMSDIFFFCMLTPACLASFDVFAREWAYRDFFFTSKVHFYGVANWLSAFTIWVVCIVSIERFFAVKDPLKRNKTEDVLNRHIIFALMGLTFITTSYVHFNQKCKTKHICSGNQIVNVCVDVRADWNSWGGINPTSQVMLTVIVLLRISHVLIAIAIPLIIILYFNFLLIHHARKVGFTFNGSIPKNRDDTLLDGKDSNLASVSRRHSETASRQRIEYRVTNIAIVIVTVFLVTNVPSAIMLSYQTLDPSTYYSDVDHGDQSKYSVQVICAFLTMSGKAINFFIFCLLSKNFRKRLRSKFMQCLCPTRTRLPSNAFELGPRRFSKKFNL